MNMAPLMLKKNPEIVETVRKCRKYTGSAEIRDVADRCYQRFKVSRPALCVAASPEAPYRLCFWNQLLAAVAHIFLAEHTR